MARLSNFEISLTVALVYSLVKTNLNYYCLQPATVAANVRSIFACLLDQVSEELHTVIIFESL